MEDGVEVAAMLAAAGGDAIETSTGMKGAIRTRITRPEREAYLLELALAVRRRTRVPVILVGGLRSRPVMERVLGQGVDLVSLSRPLIREPDLPRRLAAEAGATANCISCNRCWPEAPGAGTSCKQVAPATA
jgi:2,4-dienoyl-CoA reductase-like NADH-dependent reductase (Old Yellow Enzyme family)